jgi:hypothetical protein
MPKILRGGVNKLTNTFKVSLNFSIILLLGIFLHFSTIVKSQVTEKPPFYVSVNTTQSSFSEKIERDTTIKPDTLDAKDLKRQKIVPYAVGVTSAVCFTGVYLYMQQVWWKDNVQKFHFDWSRDYRYANNLDKMGHFMGGQLVADAYFDACKGLKMTDKQAVWWGFSVGTMVQVLIELKDGYAPNYGYSMGDMVAGSFGSLQPYLKQKSTFFRNTDFKGSYWQRTTKYFDTRGIKRIPVHIDDYINQTYWMSTSLRYLTNNRYEKIPDWLYLSLGWGIEAKSWNSNPKDPGTGGKPEFYLALDVNLLKLFKPKHKFWVQTLKRFNYIKFPMPTLQLTQKPKLWGIYF